MADAKGDSSGFGPLSAPAIASLSVQGTPTSLAALLFRPEYSVTEEAVLFADSELCPIAVSSFGTTLC